MLIMIGRSFVGRIGFGPAPATSAGPTTGRPGWLARASVVVTDLGRYRFDADGGEMVLAAIHGVTVDGVRGATGWDLEVADDLETTPDPSDDELRLIRDEPTPDGVYVKG